MTKRFHPHEKVVGPHGPGEVIRVQATDDHREFLVCYRGGRTLLVNGADLRHTFRALHPGLIGGNCANCYAPAGMHDDYGACRELDAPVVTAHERELLDIAEPSSEWLEMVFRQASDDA